MKPHCKLRPIATCPCHIISISYTYFFFPFPFLLLGADSSTTPTCAETFPVFFRVSFSASFKTSISFASQALNGSGWKVPFAENHAVKGDSISLR
jgi:hypothetical protein